MTPKQLTYLRAGASAIITALAIVYAQYPSYTWITAVIAVAATLGIHAIPAIGQSTGGSIVSEQPEAPVVAQPAAPTGAVLMGVQPAYPVQTEAPVTAPEQPQEAPEAPEAVVQEPAQEEAPTLPAAPATVPAVVVPAETPTRTAPTDSPQQTVAQRLRALADELENL